MPNLNRRQRLSRRLALLVVVLCGVGSALAQQTVATFSGHVTDQNSGQGIADVAVLAQGNQTGTRVAISDAQGNYTLPLGANTNIKLRAYKTGFLFNPLLAGFASVGGFPITGTHQLDFSGARIPILNIAQPPILLTEDESLNVLTLDALLHTREPIPPLNNNYFIADKRTRLKLFLVDLDLYSGETLSIIAVQARDTQQITYDFSVADLRKATGFPWLSELTVLAPGDLPAGSELTLSVSARGQASNVVKLHTQ